MLGSSPASVAVAAGTEDARIRNWLLCATCKRVEASQSPDEVSEHLHNDCVSTESGPGEALTRQKSFFSSSLPCDTTWRYASLKNLLARPAMLSNPAPRDKYPLLNERCRDGRQILFTGNGLQVWARSYAC